MGPPFLSVLQRVTDFRLKPPTIRTVRRRAAHGSVQFRRRARRQNNVTTQGEWIAGRRRGWKIVRIAVRIRSIPLYRQYYRNVLTNSTGILLDTIIAYTLTTGSCRSGRAE